MLAICTLKLHMLIMLVNLCYILQEEISLKHSRMKTLERDLNTHKRKLTGTLGMIRAANNFSKPVTHDVRKK